MAGPRWKKGKDGKDLSSLPAASPMSSIVAGLQSSLKRSNLMATLSSQGGDAILGVNLRQATLLNRAAFGRAVENSRADKQCRLKVWSDLLCALRASGSVAKTLLVLTISGSVCELRSPDCLEHLVVHERTITRWIAQHREQRREQGGREEENKEELDHTRETVALNHWGVMLGFTVLSSLLVYRLRF